MSAIVTKQFRTSNATVFWDSFATHNYYLALGRPVNWTDDESPPIAFESGPQIAKIQRDIMFSLYVNQASTSLVIPRINWAVNTIYDMYRHNISSSNPSSTGATTLESSKFYVINSLYNVYVCLDNNGGAASTIEPSGTSQNAFVSTDTYKWKYLYTIPTSEVQKFLSLDFMPVMEDSTIASFAIPSGIETVILNNGGSGYVDGTYTISVHGDGTGASLSITVASGAITTVTIPTNGEGTGYTFASIDLTAIEDSSVTTVAPSIDLIISPTSGFGDDNKSLLNTIFVMASVTISDDGSDDAIITGQEFRQISLIKNPLVAGVLSTALSLSSLKSMVVSGFGTTNFAKDEKITGSISGGEGVVVTFDSTTGVLRYIQQSEIGIGLDSAGDIKAFTTADTITGAVSTASASVESLTVPEMDLYSGEMLYTENRPPIFRTTDQEENIKLVVEF